MLNNLQEDIDGLNDIINKIKLRMGEITQGNTPCRTEENFSEGYSIDYFCPICNHYSGSTQYWRDIPFKTEEHSLCQQCKRKEKANIYEKI